MKNFLSFSLVNHTGGYMQLKALIMVDLLVAGTVGVIFAVIKEYSLAVFLSTFTALALGATLAKISRGKAILQWFEDEESKSLESFREKLAKEGVIELTQSIARGKRFPRGTNKINELLTLIDDDAKVVTVDGQIYAIHRATLTEILNMLPINDEEIAKLTETQRRILDVASSANVILHKDGQLEAKEKN
jgi:uncharacterized protein (UPF0216 family)